MKRRDEVIKITAKEEKNAPLPKGSRGYHPSSSIYGSTISLMDNEPTDIDIKKEDEEFSLLEEKFLKDLNIRIQ
jgi:hypothetical protein